MLNSLHRGKTAKPHRARPQWSVARENGLSGTSDWQIARRGKEESIAGFADQVSVDQGRAFRLFVSTTARSFRATAYRMGWYAGFLGRQVWRSPWIKGAQQAAPVLTPGTYMVTAPWDPTLSIETHDWPEGCYLIKLTTDEGDERYVPITVRSAHARGKTLFINEVTTWVAYNQWGLGYNVYSGPNTRAGDYSRRSRKVSFDRPYDQSGAPLFLWYELPQLALAESLGLPLAYATDLELHADLKRLAGARALIFPGHDEYWSSAMRGNALALRDSGTNIAFFGANAVYRHIRLEPSSLGDGRVLVCYKHPNEDPMLTTNPDEATQQWRLAPNPRPESELTGAMYECHPVSGDFMVVAPDSWVFRGTGAAKGQRYQGLVGVEYDRLIGGAPTPRPLQVLSDSPVVCRGVRTHANAVYYTTPAGSGVFNAGSLIWSTTLPVAGANAKVVGAQTSKFAETVTANILSEYSRGPAGLRHPAEDTYDQYVRPPLTDLPYTYAD